MKFNLIAMAAAISFATSSANAAIVSYSTPISVPNTLNGIFINLATGASGSSELSVRGWDFNPYGTRNLAFFWSSPLSRFGGVAASPDGPYTDLPPGTIISSSSVFTQNFTSANTSAFRNNRTHVLGLRFFNEGTSSINYGYLTIATSGPTGFPATITGWSFEDTGAAITFPGLAAAVPEPATWAMLLAGFGIIGAALRRRSGNSAAAFA